MPTVAEATMAVLERPRELVRVIANARPAEPVHESVPLAALLAACGGFLDAFTYVGYDHVLANSMSGNVVLAGIAVTTGQWHQIWWHLLPIMAFLAGVWAAETLRLPRVRAVVRHPTAACLGLEAAFLTIAAGSAHSPAALMTSGISFVAAAQTTTFRQLRGTPYHSVVMTGNLRSFGTASFVGLFTGDAGQRRDAARFGAVCLAFATGAAIGGWSTPTLGNPALLIVAGLLTLVLVMLRGRIPLLRQSSRCDRFPPRPVGCRPIGGRTWQDRHFNVCGALFAARSVRRAPPVVVDWPGSQQGIHTKCCEQRTAHRRGAASRCRR